MDFLDKLIKKFISSALEREVVGEEFSVETPKSELESKKEEIDELIKVKTRKLNEELSGIFDKLEEDLDILSKVDLSNKRDAEKVKQISEIGRRDYLAISGKFIEKMRDGEKDIEKINYELEKFFQASAKSHYKATFLIGKEMGEVSGDVKKIKESVNKFLKENSDLFSERKKIDDLLKEKGEIEDERKRKEDILNEIERFKKIIKVSEKELVEVNEKIENVRRSEEHERGENLALEKENKEIELKNIESNLGLILDRRVLEKYIYSEEDDSREKIVREYIHNPVKGLISDENLQIFGVLDDVKDKIGRGSLKIKGPEKIIKKIDISKEDLEDYRMTILGLRESILHLEKEIDETDLGLNELENEKLRIEEEIRDNMKKIGVLEKKVVL